MNSILPYNLPQPAKEQLLEIAARSDLLLLGETHGTQEVPRLVLELLDDLTALGYGGLGLELPRGEEKQLVEYAEGKNEPPPFFGPKDFQDGRGNAQALSLIRQTLSQAQRWKLLCFDIDFMREDETWSDRDRHMAEGLMEQWQEQCMGQKVVGICGSYHSRLIAPTQPDGGPWPSFGYNVQQMCPDLAVSSVHIVFHRGSFFNEEIRTFGLGSTPLTGGAEIRPGGWLGHTAERHLPQGTPVTFL